MASTDLDRMLRWIPLAIEGLNSWCSEVQDTPIPSDLLGMREAFKEADTFCKAQLDVARMQHELKHTSYHDSEQFRSDLLLLDAVLAGWAPRGTVWRLEDEAFVSYKDLP